jgi:rRNA-processing protein FCF1
MSSRSKSKNKSQRSKILEDDKIDELLEHITLKRPRNAYTQFCIEEVEKFKRKNKNGKIDLKKFSGECAKKWKDLGEKDQKKIQ